MARFVWVFSVNSSTLKLFSEDKTTVEISAMILQLSKNKPTTEVLNTAAGWLQSTGFAPPAPALVRPPRQAGQAADPDESYLWNTRITNIYINAVIKFLVPGPVICREQGQWRTFRKAPSVRTACVSLPLPSPSADGSVPWQRGNGQHFFSWPFGKSRASSVLSWPQPFPTGILSSFSLWKSLIVTQ